MTTTVATLDAPVRADLRARLRAGLLAIWAGVTGAALHVLQHVGLRAGTALVAGAGGQIVFAAAGFVATVPMLRRLRRRTGTWKVPELALVAFAAIFAFSTVVVGPALSGSDTAGPTPDVAIDHHGHVDTANAS